MTQITAAFSEADWQRNEQTWRAWWAGELARPIVMVEGLVPVEGHDLDFSAFEEIVLEEFPLSQPAEEVMEYYRPRYQARRYYGDAFPRWWPNFGPGIAAGYLGSKVESHRITTWFSPQRETPIEDLHFEYDPENIWWKRTQEITRAAVQKFGGSVCVGHTDLGGNADVLASFRTTEGLLIDAVESPEEFARCCNEITRLWLRYYDELYEIIKPNGRGTTPWAPIWSPGRTYMLQSDFCYMISPRMFEKYVLPDLAACCAHLDHGFYHLDGKGQIPHLKYLLALDDLRGIQWIPGDGAPPPHEWLDLLRQIRDGGKLCQVYVSAAGARTIVRELGGRGFALFVNEPMGESDAQDYLRLLAAEDRLLA